MTALLPANRLVTDSVRQADLRKTLELVLDDLDSWNQEQWITRRGCGTACCLAGTYVVKVLGAEPVYGSADSSVTSMVRVGGDLTSVVREAKLGLGLPDGHRLFAGRNSLRRLVELAWLYTGGAVDLLNRYLELAADRGDRWLEAQRYVELLDSGDAVFEYLDGERLLIDYGPAT